MRIELGALRVAFEAGEDPLPFLRALLRRLNNTELAELLGVSPKTVQRWQASGRLPRREGSPVTLLELLQAEGAAGAAEWARELLARPGSEPARRAEEEHAPRET